LHVVLALGGVVLPLLLAWLIIGRGASQRRRPRARRPRA
jgi:hypothetical protein